MAERIVNIGSHRFTQVVCLDEPGEGGACHLYRVESIEPGDMPLGVYGLALTKIEEAMHWLNHRTAELQARGVEGTNVK